MQLKMYWLELSALVFLMDLCQSSFLESPINGNGLGSKPQFVQCRSLESKTGFLLKTTHYESIIKKTYRSSHKKAGKRSFVRLFVLYFYPLRRKTYTLLSQQPSVHTTEPTTPMFDLYPLSSFFQEKVNFHPIWNVHTLGKQSDLWLLLPMYL